MSYDHTNIVSVFKDVPFDIRELHEIVPGDIIVEGHIMRNDDTRQSLVISLVHNIKSMPKTITLTRMSSKGVVRTTTYGANSEFKVRKRVD